MIAVGKTCNSKCDRCKDGYLIIKPNKSNGFFLGCTNYKPDGTGCNNAVSKKQYYTRMGYSADTEKGIIGGAKSTKYYVEKE